MLRFSAAILCLLLVLALFFIGPAGRRQVDVRLEETVMHETSLWARVAAWYTQGGFKDEYGQWHQSGHHFKFEYWEVLNEVDFEHKMTPEFYTALYDAIVTEVRKVAPQMKFIGLALTPGGATNPAYFEYFLNPRNHNPGIPLDTISYHFYASPAPDETPEVMQHTVFAQADGFVQIVRYNEYIRRRLSPETRVYINELGTILPDSQAPQLIKPIPNSYWNLCGATFAYVFGNLAALGIDIAGESQLIGYPTQFPSVTMVDWNTGAPNARFRILELLKDNFGRGERIVLTNSHSPYVYALAFLSHPLEGVRDVLHLRERLAQRFAVLHGQDASKGVRIGAN